MSDIISEGHKQCTIDALMRGEADDKSVQVAIASLLIAVTKLSDRVETMDNNMWKRDDLADFVDRRHRERCDDCPAKRYVERMQSPVVQQDAKKRSWFVEMLSSPTIRDSFLIILLVIAVLTMKMSSDEQNRLLESMKSMMTMGVSK